MIYPEYSGFAVSIWEKGKMKLLCRGKCADPADFCVSVAYRWKNCRSRIWLPALLHVDHLVLLEETWIVKGLLNKAQQERNGKTLRAFCRQVMFYKSLLYNFQKKRQLWGIFTWIWWQFKILIYWLLEIFVFACPQSI